MKYHLNIRTTSNNYRIYHPTHSNHSSFTHSTGTETAGIVTADDLVIASAGRPARARANASSVAVVVTACPTPSLLLQLLLLLVVVSPIPRSRRWSVATDGIVTVIAIVIASGRVALAATIGEKGWTETADGRNAIGSATAIVGSARSDPTGRTGPHPMRMSRTSESRRNLSTVCIRKAFWFDDGSILRCFENIPVPYSQGDDQVCESWI